MFDRILIANRGEIALRVIRTAREMGIECVAVYSEPDARALHTRMAHVAVPLGGRTPAESYLDQDKIIDAAKRRAPTRSTRATASSASAPFARRVQEGRPRSSGRRRARSTRWARRRRAPRDDEGRGAVSCRARPTPSTIAELASRARRDRLPDHA
jgi:hypothetical protein